jgi:hypothetical protein
MKLTPGITMRARTSGMFRQSLQKVEERSHFHLQSTRTFPSHPRLKCHLLGLSLLQPMELPDLALLIKNRLKSKSKRSLICLSSSRETPSQRP